MRSPVLMLAGIVFVWSSVLEGQQPDAAAQKEPEAHAAVIETTGGRTETLGKEGMWAEIPEYLKGAKIHADPLKMTDGAHEYDGTVRTGGIVLLAVPWSRAATPQRERYEMRKKNREIVAEGKWTPIDHLYLGEGEDRKGFQVFRATFAADDKFRFNSAGFPSPHLIEINDRQAGIALAKKWRELFDVTKYNPRLAIPRGSMNAASEGALALLNPSRLESTTAYNSILQREIYRQAILLAARDELGAATRDGAMREAFPHEEPADSLPFEPILMRTSDGTQTVAILRQQGPHWQKLWESELDMDVGGSLELLARACEELSRTELPTALQSAGLRKKGRPADGAAPVPDEIARQWNEFNFIAQYAVVRRLHAEIQSRGESPALLAALSRTYANLGSLTEFLWSPAHQSFKARALLYAERLMIKSNGSDVALWSRAYVRALVGLHKTAVEDLDQIEMTSQFEGSPNRPRWAELIRAHCEFDQKKLDDADADEQLRPLARYLRLLEREHTIRNHARLHAVDKLLETSPDCFRAMDVLAGVKIFEIQRATSDQAMRLLPRSLCRRLPNVSGVSEEVLKLCETGLANEENRELADDIEVQVRLRDALTTAAAADRGEPSLGVLAALIYETGFVHAWRLVNFQRNILSIPADDMIEKVRPLVEKHPYRLFIEGFGGDANSRARAQMQLAREINSTELQMTEEPMAIWLGAIGRQSGEVNFQQEAYFRSDRIYRDLANCICRPAPNFSPTGERTALGRVSPHAPLVVVPRLGNDSKLTIEQAAELEKKYAGDSTVLAALADFYGRRGRSDAAERCLAKEVKASPEWDTYSRLATYRWNRGNPEGWKETLEEFLTLETLGHEQAKTSARYSIAEYFMRLKEWDKALPYATAAAESGIGWAMFAAHRCYEGLKDWEMAEKFVRDMPDWMEWYYWCRRTGRGDLEAARTRARETIDSLTEPKASEMAAHKAAYSQLEGDLQAALDSFIVVVERTKDPAAALHAALLAHEIGKPDVRDRMLEAAELRGAQFRPSNRVRVEMIEFATLFREHLSRGKDAKFNVEECERILKKAPAGEPTNLQYLAGRFLAQQGDREKSHKYLRLAATSPVHCVARTLASVQLLENKEEIGEIREKE